MMSEEMRLDMVLDAIEAFEEEWYWEHPDGAYVREHWEEYQAEKKEFIDEWMRSAVVAHNERIEMLEEEQEKRGFYAFQDMMDMYRYER